MPFFLVYNTETELVRGCEDHPEGGLANPGEGWSVLPVATRMHTGRGDKVHDQTYVPYVNTQAEEITLFKQAATANYLVLIGAGFTHNGVLFQIDPESQTQLAAMSLMALGSITDPENSPWPAAFYWLAADNTHVSMDAPAMYAFGRAVAGYVSASILNLRSIKDALALTTSLTELAAININAGYPAATN